MSKKLDEIVGKLDPSVAGVMKEFAEDIKGDFQAELEKSNEEIKKQKEMFKAMGIDWDKESPETLKMLKSLKDGVSKPSDSSREERLKALGGLFGAYAGSKGSMSVAKEMVKNWKNDPVNLSQKDFLETVEKAVETSTAQGGGIVVSDVYSNDFIMALRDQEFISKLGLRRVNFTGGRYIIGKYNAGVTGAYAGETKKIAKDQPKMGNVILMPKKAGVIVPIANEWIVNADQGAFKNLTMDSLNAMEELRGYTLLEGIKTEHTPGGLSSMVNASNVKATAGITNVQVISDLLYGRKQVTQSKIQIRKGALIMNPAQEIYLMGLQDNGRFLFRDEMITGKLFGMPYHVTTAARITSSKSKLYFADFDKIYEASNRGLEMRQSDSATYVNGNGTSINAFEQDMELMKLTYAHDFGTQYDKSIAIVENIAWGN